MTEAAIITIAVVSGLNVAFATLLHFAYKLRRDQFAKGRKPFDLN